MVELNTSPQTASSDGSLSISTPTNSHVIKHITTHYATAKKIYVIGTPELKSEIEAAGFTVVCEQSRYVDMDEFENYVLDPEVGLVVYGFCEDVTCGMLEAACQYINENEVSNQKVTIYKHGQVNLLVIDDTMFKDIGGRLYP